MNQPTIGKTEMHESGNYKYLIHVNTSFLWSPWAFRGFAKMDFGITSYWHGHGHVDAASVTGQQQATTTKETLKSFVKTCHSEEAGGR